MTDVFAEPRMAEIRANLPTTDDERQSTAHRFRRR
jgi:hypothetical protein